MTPRKPHPNDPITWDGIDLMIRAYDDNVIVPRQTKQHEANQAWLEKLECSIQEVADIVTSWKWPIKVIMGLLVTILTGVILLVFDWIKWGMTNHWTWK